MKKFILFCLLLANNQGYASYEAGSANQVLRVPSGGGRAKYGQVNVGSGAAVTGTLPVANGGTGQSAFTNGQLLIGNTSTGGLSTSTLTAGSNITVTNSAGGVTIASTPASSMPISALQTSNFSMAATASGTVYQIQNASTVTATLPLAATAGNGFVVTVLRPSSSAFSNTVHKIQTAGSDNLYQNSSSQSFVNSYTPGESYTFVSDGASTWHTLTHQTNTNWTANMATVTTATTTNPGKAGSPLSDYMRWRRVGNNAELIWSYSNGGSAGSAGNGDYLFALPTGLSFDSMVQFYTPVIGNGGLSKGVDQWPAGYAAFNGQNYSTTLIPYDSTHFRLYIHQTAGVICSAVNINYGATLINISVKAMIPVAGWTE